MIYDCMLYNGEKELLELRINELSLCDDWVTHVIIESSKTFSGWEKPLYFQSEAEYFKRYKNITYMVVDDPPLNCDAWTRERHQRNQMITFLKFLQPKEDDNIIIADVDEVPRAKQVNLFKSNMNFAALILDKYAYYLNYLESEQSWDRARIMSWNYLKSRTPEEVRNSGYDLSIHHAGWHWGWLGGPDKAVQKLESFSHQELHTPINVERVQAQENIWSGVELKEVSIDLSYPEYLVKNIDQFKHLIK